MKTFLLSGIFAFISLCLFGQDKQTKKQAGIYLTAEDYINGKPITADKVQLNHFSSGHSVYIIKDGKKRSFYKDSIFGFRDNEGKSYRFYKVYNDEFLIVENAKLVIYVTYEPNHTSKGLCLDCSTNYYFSAGLNSPVSPLTISNLKQAYPTNTAFHHKLDTFFGDGTPLYTYDSKDKMYMVNSLLTNSINQ